MARGIVKLTRRQLQRELKARKIEVTTLTENRLAAQKAYMAQIDSLNSKLNQLQTSEDLRHLAARTELIKAVSCAMKACSSIMWSEKQTGWDYQRARQMEVMQVRK